MTWGEILAEFRAAGIGPVILGVIRQLCAQTARRYPPAIYANSASWDDAAVADLVQDVIVERLLGEHQLDYIVATAHSISEFERLVTQQIKRCLTRRRRRTIADNMIDRSREILGQPPFAQVQGVSPIRYQLAGRVTDTRDPSATELRAAALVARAVPRDAPGVARQRAPRVYTTEALRALLEGVVRTLPTSVSVRTLDDIFRLLLTDLIPSDLDEGDVDEDVQAAAEGDPVGSVVLQSVVERLIGRLTDDQKVILKMKAADVADGEVATVIGVSRPTLADRKHKIFELIRSETTDLDDGQREDAVSLTLLALTKGSGDA
jgi:hypothetical protein